MTSKRRQSYTSQELAGALRLVVDTCEAAADGRDWRLVFAEGLTRLCEAPVAVVGYVEGTDDGGYAPVGPAVFVGLTDAPEVGAMQAYHTEPAASDPMMARFLEVPDRLKVRSRPQLIDDAAWYRSRHVDEYRRTARVDHCVYATGLIRPGGSRDVFGIGIHRRWREPDIPSRKAQLAGLLVDALVPLARRSFEDPRRRLPAATLRVVRCLERGLSEKEAAAELCISRHTVHYHAKRAYRTLGVTSRAELIARLKSVVRAPARDAEPPRPGTRR